MSQGLIILPSGRRLFTGVFDSVQLVRSFLHGGVNMELWEIKVSKGDHVFRSVHASQEEAELSIIALCYFIEHIS